jgi:DNA polymerase-1
MGTAGMAKARGVSVTEAKDFLRMYHRTFPSIYRLLDRCKAELEQQGYVEDWFGKKYHVPPNQAYKAIPCLVQGGCAQAFKIGLIQVDNYLSNLKWAYIVLPVHDEIQIESKIMTRKAEKLFCSEIVEQMTNIPQLLERDLRLRVDVKKTMTNWAEKVKVEF